MGEVKQVNVFATVYNTVPANRHHSVRLKVQHEHVYSMCSGPSPTAPTGSKWNKHLKTLDYMCPYILDVQANTQSIHIRRRSERLRSF